MNTAVLEDTDTQPLPAVTKKLPAVQFARPTPFSVLDARLQVTPRQRDLLVRLGFLRTCEGTLAELWERLHLWFPAEDLTALFAQGYIALGQDAGVWWMEARG